MSTQGYCILLFLVLFVAVKFADPHALVNTKVSSDEETSGSGSGDDSDCPNDDEDCYNGHVSDGSGSESGHVTDGSGSGSGDGETKNAISSVDSVTRNSADIAVQGTYSRYADCLSDDEDCWFGGGSGSGEGSGIW